MLDREILATRLGRLRDALRKLREIGARPEEAYLASETERALSEHYLRIALETALDAGNRRGSKSPLRG